jgi:molybdopterin-guanine dinucleotide biosynthesis protein B
MIVQPYTLCIVANESKTGKTTLIERLIPVFKDQGIPVATIKHLGGTHPYESKEKDSAKHLIAGAEIAVAINSNTITLRYSKSTGSDQLHSALSSLMAITPHHLPQLILIEGYKQSEFPKIFLIKSRNDLNSLPAGKILLTSGIHLDSETALAEIPSSMNPVVFSNTNEIVKTIKENAIAFTLENLPAIDCGECGYPTCLEFAQALWQKHDKPMECFNLYGTLHLEVNGKKIPIKSFVQNIIAQGVRGMVGALKGVENPTEIKIHLNRNPSK